MSRGTPNGKLIVFLTAGLAVMCGGLIVMMEFAKVEIKKRGQPPEQTKATAPEHPFAARLKELTPNEFAATQGTQDDFPSMGRYVRTVAEGVYHDVVSMEPLFSSADKLEPQQGFAEFSRPLDAARLVEEQGVINGEDRLHVKGRTSGARLGWVATGDDGTRRYVMNSSALKFVPAGDSRE
jgi:peptide-methionine (R)-S-oxide reductase